MIIGVIGAMDEEVKILKDKMIIEKRELKARMEFFSGSLLGKNVVVVTCGIGKVNAAVCTQILIDDFKVNNIINVGVAGGIGEEILPGDVVIGENMVQHDMDTSVFGDKLGQIPRLDTFDFKCDNKLVETARIACTDIKNHKTFSGRIVSGDQFIADTEKIRWLKKEFGALACEMEGGSIAQVCYLNSVPFVVIRSISDNADTGAHMDYQKFVPIAVDNSIHIIERMLHIL